MECPLGTITVHGVAEATWLMPAPVPISGVIETLVTAPPRISTQQA